MSLRRCEALQPRKSILVLFDKRPAKPLESSLGRCDGYDRHHRRNTNNLTRPNNTQSFTPKTPRNPHSLPRGGRVPSPTEDALAKALIPPPGWTEVRFSHRRAIQDVYTAHKTIAALQHGFVEPNRTTMTEAMRQYERDVLKSVTWRGRAKR